MSKNQKAANKPAAAKPEQTAVATQAPANLPTRAQALPPGVKLVKRITLPSLALKNKGETRILAIADAMRVSTIQDKKGADGTKPRDPATICTVGDVMTGEVFTFIVPSVVKANLNRDYPNDGYVGRAFLIEHMGKRNESQRYADFSLSEVDVSGVNAEGATE